MIGLVLAAAISWPGQYNAGVTAYRSNDFSSAAATFEQATAAPERALQQRAFYNLGNTTYRLGEADPQKAQALWERAIKSYDSAIALDPKDDDAKFNREFVKKKLEELKQQQQQQQQQQQNQDKPDQQKKDQQQQHNQDQSKNQQQQQQEKEQEKEQEKQQGKSQEQQKSEEQQKQEQQQAQAQPDKLDKQEAKALLDQLRENEQNWNFFPEVQMKDLKDSGPPAKDW
jgi:Ca-activated chloride channel family protein